MRYSRLFLPLLFIEHILLFSIFYVYADEGALKWSNQTGNIVRACPAIADDGTIYIGTSEDDGKFYAINPDGTKKWEFFVRARIRGSAAIGEDGTIYFGAYDNFFYAIKPDGTLQWKYLTGDYVRTTPAISEDGTIYFGSRDGFLYALNPNGSVKWSYQTGGKIGYSSPVIGSNGEIDIGTYIDNKLYAVNSNGTLKWTYECSGEIYTSPVIGNDRTLYFGSSGESNSLYAVNPDGTTKWIFNAQSVFLYSPAIGSDGIIYAPSVNSLHAIYPNGEIKWAHTFEYSISTAPAIAYDGTIIIGVSYKVYAINPDNASVRWEYLTDYVETLDPISGYPTIGADGTVYIGTDSYGYLLAINSERGPLADTTWPKFHLNLKQTGRQSVLYSQFRCANDIYRYDIGDDGGQCVLYVRSETDIPYSAFNGNASTCFQKAKDAGYATGSCPKESAIVVFGAQTSMPYGHVGIVCSIDGSDKITVRHSNWSLDETVSENQISSNRYEIEGYIYCDGSTDCGSSSILADADADGVIDQWDQCPQTPFDSVVYSNGCPAIKGDWNNNKQLDILDSIGILQTITGLR